MTEEHRDDELGRLIAGLRAPEHRAGFWAEVRAELDDNPGEIPSSAPSTAAPAPVEADLVENEEPVSLAAARARRLRLRPALVAAAVVLIGLISVGLVLRDDHDEEPVGVTTHPTTVTGPDVLAAPTGPLRADGSPLTLGSGRLVGVDPTGSFVYVADASPDGGLGCEGSPAQSLFVQPVAGGERSIALPASLGDATGGIEIRFGPQGEVAVMTQCEGYGATVVTGTMTDDGTIADPVERTISDVDLGRPVDSILDLEYRAARTLVASTYAIGADGSEHRHVYEFSAEPGAVTDLGGTDVVHLDVDASGRVATSSTDGTIRFDGEVVAQVSGVVDLSVTPSGREIVVATGDGDHLVAVDTTSGQQTVLARPPGVTGVASAVAVEAVSDGVVVATVGDENGRWRVVSVGFDGSAPTMGLALDVPGPTEMALPADRSRLFLTGTGGADGGTSVVAQDLTR